MVSRHVKSEMNAVLSYFTNFLEELVGFGKFKEKKAFELNLRRKLRVAKYTRRDSTSDEIRHPQLSGKQQ